MFCPTSHSAPRIYGNSHCETAARLNSRRILGAKVQQSQNIHIERTVISPAPPGLVSCERPDEHECCARILKLTAPHPDRRIAGPPAGPLRAVVAAPAPGGGP